MSNRTRPAPNQTTALLAEHSPVLSMALERRFEVRDRLITKGGWTKQVRPTDWLPGADPSGRKKLSEAELQTALRLGKEAVFIHLALRDLAGLAPLSEAVSVLSELAALALNRALENGRRILLKKYDLPPWPPGEPDFFCILGMGKLGAEELNYSSDIDLIYIYEPALWPWGQLISPAEAAAWLGTFIGRAMGKPTTEGLVFRVDTDLRPAGKDGALAASLASARHHYLYLAAEWERLALIKMNPLAGNLELGRELIAETRPFVFRRHLDYMALDELAELKGKIAARNRSLTQTGFDLKLDKGGIRQLEFFVQTLQLIFGGRNPALRRLATLDTLDDLAEAELISDRERDELKKAYVFLRQAEHRVQLRNLAQTQSLPQGREELDKLGRAMGGGGADPGRDFMDDLDRHTSLVGRHFESLLGGPAPQKDDRLLVRLLEAIDQNNETLCLDMLAMAGFEDPGRALKTITQLTSSSFLPHSLSRQRKLLRQVVPATLDRVLASIEPDAALIRLAELLTRIGPKTGLFMLLRENPGVIELVVRVLASSAYLTRILIAHPGLLDSLIDYRGHHDKTGEEMGAELDTLLDAGADEEDKISLLRRFKAEETLRIAVRDLSDELALEQVSDQLSDLADTVLIRTLSLARELVRPRFERLGVAEPSFAVLALGKLGGRELAYHSDLDVIFLHRPAPGSDPGSAGEYAVKLAQRMISLLSAPLAEGPGYELDARLRPSGRQGPLVVTLDAFTHYHQTSQTWEKLALTKSRVVAGDPAFLKEAAGVVEEAVFNTQLARGWSRELLDLRLRMAGERGAGTGWDIKFGDGGLIDVEFSAEAIQLYAGRTDESLRMPHILKGLKAQHVAGLLSRENFEALYRGYRYLRSLDHRLRLLYDRAGDKAGYTDREIGRAGGEAAELAKVTDEVSRAAAEVFKGF